MASDDPAAVQARVDELEVELRSIVLAQGLVQQNNVAPEEQEEQVIDRGSALTSGLPPETYPSSHSRPILQ
jgi:hypothetical protein